MAEELSLAWKIGISVIVIVLVVAIILIIGFLYNWGQPITSLSSSGRISSSLPPIEPGLVLDGTRVLQQVQKFPYYDVSGNKPFFIEITADIQSVGTMVSSFVQNSTSGNQFFLENAIGNSLSGTRVGASVDAPPQTVISGPDTYAFNYDGINETLAVFAGLPVRQKTIRTNVTNVLPTAGFGLTIGCRYIDGQPIRPISVIKAVLYRFKFYSSATPDPEHLEGDFSFGKGQTIIRNQVPGRTDTFFLMFADQAGLNLTQQ